MKKLIKILLFTLIIIVVLGVILVVVVTRPFFIKSVILPIAEKNIKGTILFDKLEFHPLTTSILVTNLNIKSSDGYSVKIEKLYAIVNILDIINKKISIKQVDLNNIFVDFSNGNDKNSATGYNTELIHNSSSSNKLFPIDISNVNIRNLNLNYESKGKTPAESTVFKVSNFNLLIPELKTGGKGYIEMFGDILISQGDCSNLLNGKVKSKTILTFNTHTFPTALESNTVLKLGGNITPIHLAVTTNGKAFKFTGRIENANFDPFFNALMKGSMNESTGYINSLIINAEGTDIQSPDIVAEITGDARFNIRFDSSNFNLKTDTYNLVFNLNDILHNNINIKKFTVNDTFVNIVNTPVIVPTQTQQKSTSDSENKTTSSTSQSMTFNLNNIDVKNFNLTYIDSTKAKGDITTVKLTNLGLSIPVLKPDSAGNMSYDGNLLISADGHNFDGNINGSTQILLDKNSILRSLDSKNNITLNGRATAINFKATSTDDNILKFKAVAGYLQLDPFLVIFNKDENKKISGYIDGLAMSADTSDIKNLNINTNITGKAELNYADEGGSYNLHTGNFDLSFNVADLVNKSFFIKHFNIENPYIKVTKYDEQQLNEQISKTTPKISPISKSTDSTSIASDPPLSIDLNNIMIKKATMIYNKIGQTHAESSNLKIEDLNLSIPRLKTDGKGQINFSANIISSRDNDSNAIKGRIESTTTITLNKNIFPTMIDSITNITIGNEVTPINLFITTSDNKTIKFKATLGLLELDPFFAMLINHENKKITGHIDNLSISAEASDLKTLNMNTNISGKAELNYSDAGETYNIDTGNFDLGFNASDLVNKNITLGHLSIERPQINIVKNTDKQPKGQVPESDSNIPLDAAISADSSPIIGDLPFSIDLNNVSIKSGSMIYNSIGKIQAESSILKIEDLNLSIPKLKTDGKGQIDFSANIISSRNNTFNTIKGRVESTTTISLNKNIFPTMLDSTTNISFGNEVTPINLFITTENEKSFKFEGNIKSLNLNPIFSMFMNGPMRGSTGYINGLTINAIGPDLKSTDISVDVTCSAQASITDENSLYNLNTEKLYLQFNVDDFIHNKVAIKELNLDNTNIEVVKTVFTASVKEDVQISKQPLTESTQAPNYPYLDLNKIDIRNLNLAYIFKDKTGTTGNESRITNLNIMIPSLRTNELGTMEYNGNIAITSAQTKNTLSCKIDGNTAIKINRSMLPDALQSKSELHFGENVTLINAMVVTDETKLFKFTASLKNLPLDPIFQTFLQGSISKSNGLMNSLTISGYGKDIQSPDVVKTINADITSEFTDINIPVELMNTPVTKFIFMPIYFVSQLNKYLAVKALSKDANDMLAQAADIIKGSKPLKFQHGTVDVSINNYNANIHKILFTDTPKSIVSKLDICGEISGFNNLKLDTYTVIAKFNLPIHIDGTLNDPKPDMSKLAVEFVGSNVDNILGSVKQTAIMLGGNLNKQTQQIIQALPDDQSQSDDQQSLQTSTQNDDPAGQVLSASVGILKGLLNK